MGSWNKFSFILLLDSDGGKATSNVKEVSSYTIRPKATVPAAVIKDVETTPQSLLITGDNRVKVEVKTRTAFIICAVFLTAVLMMIGILSKFLIQLR